MDAHSACGERKVRLEQGGGSCLGRDASRFLQSAWTGSPSEAATYCESKVFFQDGGEEDQGCWRCLRAHSLSLGEGLGDVTISTLVRQCSRR